jgi:hypothetical protein
MTKPKESVFYKSETTKHSMNSSCTLKLSCETEKKKKEINERLKKLVKNYITTPEKLLQYMQLQGMKVYKFKNASKILKCLKEEGFLTPLKGYKAIILNLIIGLIFEKKLKLSFTTNAMFIFNLDNMEIYTIARALHKYYGFKNNLPGFDFKSQEIFKKVYNSSKKTSAPFSQCRINDLYACKEAIARDLDSINFTIDLSVEYERSLDVLKKMKETSATI